MTIALEPKSFHLLLSAPATITTAASATSSEETETKKHHKDKQTEIQEQVLALLSNKALYKRFTQQLTESPTLLRALLCNLKNYFQDDRDHQKLLSKTLLNVYGRNHGDCKAIIDILVDTGNILYIPKLFKMVPSSAPFITSAIETYHPYHTASKEEHSSFFKRILGVCRECPSLRTQILSILLHKAFILDSQGQDAIPQIEAVVLLLMQFHRSTGIEEDLLTSTFEEQVMKTPTLQYVQFIYFYAASLQPSRLSDQFLSLLFVPLVGFCKGLDGGGRLAVPMTMLNHSIGMIGSFVAHADFLPASLLVLSWDILVDLLVHLMQSPNKELAMLTLYNLIYIWNSKSVDLLAMHGGDNLNETICMLLDENLEILRYFDPLMVEQFFELLKRERVLMREECEEYLSEYRKLDVFKKDFCLPFSGPTSLCIQAFIKRSVD